MRKINKKALIISVLFALVGAVLLFQYIRSIQTPVAEKPKTSIYTAIRSFQAGEEVMASDILEKKVDSSSVTLMGIRDREKIAGKIVKLPILAGEVFTAERLAEKSEMILSYQIPEGKCAINLFVNESVLFSNLIQVGDRIDIIGNFSSGDGALGIRPFVQTILQNIEILAIGSDKIKDNPKEAAPDKLAKTITLAVTPEEAEKIVYVTAYGQFSVVLRKKDDEQIQTIKEIILDDFVPAGAKLESGE